MFQRLSFFVSFANFPKQILDARANMCILYMYCMNSEVRLVRIVLSNDSKQAIWEQIAEQIKDAIMKGELNPGDPLPSIRSLARELRISVITTKRAYDELEAERFVDSVQGKGSFVATQDTALMREKRLHTIEARLSEALIEARLLGLTYSELEQMLRILWEE